MNTLTYALKLSNGAFIGPARQAQAAIGQLNVQSGAASGGFRRMGGSMLALGGVLGSLTAAFAGLKTAVASAANMETMQVSFANLIGSAKQAQDTLGQLADFAARTPFELPEITQAAKTLLGAGVSAQDLQGSLQTMGNLASAFGADLSTVATITAQVINKTQLYAEELQQLGENGVPALRLLSESMGKSTAEIIAMATAGQLTGKDLAKAFDDAAGAGGKFAGAMAQQAQTVNGMFSTLKDGVAEVARVVGQPINEHMMKPMLADAIAALPQVLGGLRAAGGLLRAAFDAGGISEVADVLQLSLRYAFARSVTFFGGALIKAGGSAIQFIGAQLQKVLSGDFSGLANAMKASPYGRLADLLDVDGLGKELQAKLASLGNAPALDQLQKAMAGKLQAAAADGTGKGLADALSKITGQGGKPGAGDSKRSLRAAGGDGDGNGAGFGGGGGTGGGRISRGTIRRGDADRIGLPEGLRPDRDSRSLRGLGLFDLAQQRRATKVPGATEIGQGSRLVPVGKLFDLGTDPRRAAALNGMGRIGGADFKGLDAFRQAQEARQAALNAARGGGRLAMPQPAVKAAGQEKESKREKELKAQQQMQQQAQPRWDSVLNIEAMMKKLTTA